MRIKKRKLGMAFPDEMVKVAKGSGHFHRGKLGDPTWQDLLMPNYSPEEFQEPTSVWRPVVLFSIFLVFFFGLFLRLFHLQAVEGVKNRERADFNRVQIRVIHAPRGVIYDRNGKVLAENSPGFRLKGEFLNRDEALLLEAKNDQAVPELEIDAIRYYPLAEVTAHILGYVGQVSAQELKDPKFATYKIGDRIGRAGIEQQYEEALRGVDGAEVIEIDASGKTLQTLRRVEPKPGKNIYLTLDGELQKAAANALRKGLEKVKSCCGALVAENPKTGEILALVSLPSFDANAFTDPKRGGETTAYFTQSNAPMLNRVTAGTYPPGSTFKITSALAGLSSGKINKDTQFEDTGVMNLGTYSFANWYFTQYGRKEGFLDVVGAIRRSNDIFFYQVGNLVGEKILGDVAGSLGFGKRLGIDLPGEATGLVPDREWKEKEVDEVWYPGDNLHLAIGQGFLLATPLQVLAQTAFIAADGDLFKPYLVGKIMTATGQTVKQISVKPSHPSFDKKDLEVIKKGLMEVTVEGGTAWPFFNFPIPTAGKTGTAEFGDPKGLTHAWYTTYAPSDDPKITLTVLVEKGGEGSNVAAPIAREVYSYFFNINQPPIEEKVGIGD